MKVVKELTVFLENKPGTLARLTGELAERSINILGFDLSNALDHGALRLIVDDPTAAAHVLGEYNMFVLEADVLSVRLKNQVGALTSLANALADSGVNVEYAYGSTDAQHTDATTMYLRVSDAAKAEGIMRTIDGVE